MKRIGVLLVLLCAVVPLIAGADASPLPNVPHVYVEGSASIEAPTAFVDIQVVFSQENASASNAESVVNRKTLALIDTLVRMGVQAGDISAADVSLQPAYKDVKDTRVETGFKVERKMNVTLRRIEDFQRVTSAILKGEVRVIEAIEPHSSDDRALELRAQAAALNDARERATKLATASGATLGSVHSISEFDLREDERYALRASRETSGPNRAVAVGVSGDEPIHVPQFVPDTVTASAKVFVVYLLGAAG